MKRAGVMQASAAIILALLVALLRASGVVRDTAPLPRRPVDRPMLAPTVEPGERILQRTGFVAPNMDLSYLAGNQVPASLTGTQSPERLDWRTTGKVTPVKNQGVCGACYAFSTVGNLESSLLVGGRGLTNLSENNAKECNWWETTGYESPPGSPRGSCDGGSTVMVANLFSQEGTVTESCDPYAATDTGCKSTCRYQHTLLGWSQISGPVIPDKEVLKAYVQAYGPIATTLYTGAGDAWETAFHGYDGSYTLHHAGTEPPNHGVLIIGWDDSLPHAGGSGAWIVKNSWGTGWGGSVGYGSEGGYFTIAYGSANIGWYSSFSYEWQDYDPAGDLLYYDEAGWTSALGYNGGTTAWGLTKFTPPESGFVTRVEFWTVDSTSDVDLYLYDEFDGRAPSRLLWSRQDLSFDNAGYHGVTLDPPLAIYAGDDVTVVAKLTNGGATCPVAVDSQGQHEVGRTFVSCTGSADTWLDAGSEMGVDVAIRLRTTSQEYVPTPAPAAQTFVPLILMRSGPGASANPGWQTIVSDGFEGALTDDAHTYGSPTWGASNCRSSAGAGSAWAAATGPGAQTPCVDSYPANMSSWLVYGPFDLSEATLAEVKFQRWNRTQAGHDYLSWLASTDGSVFWGLRAEGDSGGWVGQVFDLTSVPSLGDVTGEPRVWVAFHASSDGSGTDEGAFLDQVEVRSCQECSAAASGAGSLEDGLETVSAVFSTH